MIGRLPTPSFVFFLALILSTVEASSASIKVQPMVLDVEPFGTSSRATLVVTNDLDAPTGFDITALKLEISEDGSEILTPSADDFVIFPPTLLVPAKSKQSVQLQFIGDPTLETSHLFRVRVEQLSVRFDSNETGINTALAFNVLVKVIPDGAVPELVVTSINTTDDPDVFSLSVSNLGNRYALLKKSKWSITVGSTVTDIPGSELADRLSGDYVGPRSTTTVRFRRPSGVDLMDSRIQIDAK